MSQPTSALHTALSTDAKNGMGAKVIIERSIAGTDSTKSEFYVMGGADAPGVARWITTTASDNAATQASTILTKLKEK